MTAPTGVSYRRIVGCVITPEGRAPIGTIVRFTAAPTRITDTSSTPPALALTVPVVGRVGGDYALRDQNGDAGVQVLDPNDTSQNPHGYSYLVEIEIPGGAPLHYSIDIPPGSEDVDLASATPVDPTLGTPNVQGPPGEKGDPGEVGPPGAGVPATTGATTNDVIKYDGTTTGWGKVGWGELSDKPAVIGAGADQAAARTAIGAGTSSLALGGTSATAMPGNKTASDLGGATKTLGGAETVAALATSGTVTMDCAAASVFTISPSGAFTLAFSNVPASGTACTITLVVTMGATAYAMTAPASVKWFTSAPALAASKRGIVTLMTVDGGTTWLASGADEK